MPIVAADIQHRLSTATATEGDADPQPSPSASLGRHVSTTSLVNGTLHNLFPKVGSADAAAGVTRYLCVFIYNAHATLPLNNATIRLAAQNEVGAFLAVGVDPMAASPVDDPEPQALEVASITTAPAGVEFSAPTISTYALDLGDIPAGYVKAVWFRLRVEPDAPAVSVDEAAYIVAGQTL